MQTTKYTIPTKANVPSLKLALVADLHNKPFVRIIEACRAYKPDLILIPGDLMSGLDTDDSYGANTSGFSFLHTAAKIAPTFYSVGNHERTVSGENAVRIAESGAVLLDNAAIQFAGINIGGLSSGFGNARQGNTAETPDPDTEWLRHFSALPGYKVLLCHHPEYYPKYIKQLPIDLTLSGHAHGGQWRLFGRGVFAPGQGLFPKYTSGIHENRLIVSRGLANTTPFPRFFNPTELVFIELVSQRV